MYNLNIFINNWELETRDVNCVRSFETCRNCILIEYRFIKRLIKFGVTFEKK